MKTRKGLCDRRSRHQRFSNKSSLIVTIITLFGLLLGPRANATIFDDILAIATAGRDRATEARDNAATARDNALEINETIQNAVATISADMRQIIAEGVEDAGAIVQEELEGRQTFIDTGCVDFKASLVTLLQRLETIFNGLAVIADPESPMSVSLQDEIAIVQAAPCRALFPLYRVLIAVDFPNQRLLDRLDEGASSLILLKDIVAQRYNDDNGNAPASRPMSVIDFELGQTVNQLVLDNPDAASAAALAVKLLGKTLNFVSKRMEAKAESGVDEVKIGIHGYVGAHIKIATLKKWGKILESVAEALKDVADDAGDNIDHAMLIGGLAELRDQDFAILENQATILKLLAKPGLR